MPKESQTIYYIILINVSLFFSKSFSIGFLCQKKPGYEINL